MISIVCHSDCVHLNPNSDYQQKRAGDRFGQDRREFYKTLLQSGGEAAAALFNLIEVVTFGYFHSRRDGQDGEVIAGLQSLRRSLSPLHIPAGPPPVFAEQLKKEYEAFAARQAEWRQTGQPSIDQQTAIEVVDRALAFITDISGAGLQSRRFLNGLIGYIKTHHPEVAEQITKEGHEGGRIALPSQFPISEAPGREYYLHHH